MPTRLTKRRFDSIGRFEYYNNTTKETVFPLADVRFIDDFLVGGGVVFPAAGSPESGCPWVKKIVGAGPPTVAAVADGVNGLVACTLTADSEKQSADLYTNDELQFSIVQGLCVEFKISPTVLPTLAAELNFGLISSWADGYDATTYNVMGTFDGSGELFFEKDDNATDESATSGVTLTAGQSAIVKIDCTDIASIKFYVNGVRKAEGTVFDWAASAANSKVQPFFGAYKASGAGVGTLTVDYVKVWQNRA